VEQDHGHDRVLFFILSAVSNALTPLISGCASQLVQLKIATARWNV